MSGNETDHLVRRLDILIKLAAAQITAGKTRNDAILQLSELGFEPKEVAAILGATANHVSVALYQARRGRRAVRPSSDSGG